MKASETIERASERVRQVWAKRQADKCMWGALEYVRASPDLLILTARVIQEQYPDRLGPGFIEERGERINSVGTLARFNDHPDTTRKDVLAVFDKARVKAEEMV